MLHPAGTGQDLGVFELVTGDLGAGVIEDHEPGTRGALIHGPDEIRHCSSLSNPFLPDPDITG